MTPAQQIVDAQNVPDAVLAAGALSAPLWIRFLDDGLHVYVLVGGALLLTLRVIQAILEIRKNLKDK